ncbi:MAG: VWA domain-containing protein [Desulfobacter sp.]|nr:MAG: VWA domain-containing protein [Desulfobacter sp.]
MRRSVLGLSAILLVMFGILATGYAGGKSNLILIFDASGSMWGQINGKAKITIAKEAMDLIINDLPKDINIGLVAYGHRRKGDCDDVETMIPLGPLNAETFLAKIKSLNPKGKTPMVRSIRKTAEAIKHLEDETTILLVSDGEETCDPEPCNFVVQLEKLGIKFVLHVVGFDVGGQTEAQLKCMAKAGGGEYFPAKDAGKLKHALDTVIKKTVAKNLVVTSFDGKNNPVSVMIKVVDSSGNTVATDGGKRVSFGLVPGTYTLKVNPDTLTQKITVENVVVTESKVTQKKVVFAKSQIIVSMKDGNGNNVPGYIRIVDQKSGQSAEEGDHKGKISGFIVSPGEYIVDMECSNTGRRIKSEPFSIQPGENRNINGICANVRIGVLVTDAEGTPIKGYIRVVNLSPNEYGDEAYSESAMRFFEVPPGQYKVDVECPGDSRLRSTPFYIRQGQENKVRVNCGTKEINSALPSGDTGAASPAKAGKSISAVGASPSPVNQTTQKTVTQPGASGNPQDMQAMADQMQATAQKQAAQAQTDAMA